MTPGPPRISFSTVACRLKSRSTFSPTPNPSVSTNPARFFICFTNGPCARASTRRKKSFKLLWTKSRNSARSIPISRVTSALPAIFERASRRRSAPKARTSAASKSGSIFPTPPAASSFCVVPHDARRFALRYSIPREVRLRRIYSMTHTKRVRLSWLHCLLPVLLGLALASLSRGQMPEDRSNKKLDISEIVRQYGRVSRQTPTAATPAKPTVRLANSSALSAASENDYWFQKASALVEKRFDDLEKAAREARTG